MIARWELHVEWHRGYRPYVRLRRAARHGQRVLNGDTPGVLAACPTCSGSGFLHVPDRQPPPPWSDPVLGKARLR